MHEDEEETLDIVDGLCLIPDIERHLEQPLKSFTSNFFL